MKPLVVLAAVLSAAVLLTSFSRPLEPLTRIHGKVVYPDGLTIPTTWWRVGLILARTEAQPVVVDGETYQDLVVYREPEVWMVDVPRKNGRHVVDPGPSLGFHIPVVRYRGDLDWKNDLVGLEVGRELGFMKDRGVQPVTDPKDAPGVSRYRYTDPTTGYQAELTVGPGSIPLGVVLSSDAGPLVSLVYDDYQTGLPVDLTLFQKPAGVDFTD